MYRWRHLSPEDQVSLLEWRRKLNRPWHSPPHFTKSSGWFHLTAACFEHECIVGNSNDRMKEFCGELLQCMDQTCTSVSAWCVLPNHYHVLVEVSDLKVVLRSLARLHGRSAHSWNGADATRGRKVWCAAADRWIRNEGHFWATLNYIHHNPVKHGWAQRWQDWPFGSATDYLRSVGREKAKNIWGQYPVLDYGRGWDD